MNTEKTINILNVLIQMNNDRIEGYERAINDTEEEDLKVLFGEFSATSRRLNDELVDEVENLDGEPIEGSTTSGKLFRIWMDVKSALTRKDIFGILNSCEYGEEWAVKEYERVINEQWEFLTVDQIEMLRDQYVLIKKDHDEIKEFRNQVKV
jgi:uncharacterized protein (TIGR02284 family)